MFAMGNNMRKINMISIEKMTYGGWKNCWKITDGRTEAVITGDVGPRVIRYAFVDGQNVFRNFEEQIGISGGNEWNIYGGHRLWCAPEDKIRTYQPDNSSINIEIQDNVVLATQNTETKTGIQKQMEISFEDDGRLKVLHRLLNRNSTDIEMAVWALSVMDFNGTAIIPQESFKSHEDDVLPARPLVLWPYTNMADSRFTWGEKYIFLKQTPNEKPQKIGMQSTVGWAAYILNDEVFIKTHDCVAGAKYVDFGCNLEIFTNKDILEIETLGEFKNVQAGNVAEHAEFWSLHKEKIDLCEDEIDKKLLPLIKK